MSLGVRILYPYNVTEVSNSANFVNYNNKYLLSDDAVVKSIIRIRAKSYDNFGESSETPSITDPIAYIQISNDSSFSSSRTLTLPYTENDQYDLSSLSGYTGSPIITSIVDQDAILNIMRITNWILDTGEGEKTVHLRFVTGGVVPHTFPDPTATIKGWWDGIIVTKEPPSVPTILRVDNETTNHYVGKTTTFSWIESEDNVSGLRGYNVDIELTNNDEIIEECNNLDDFEISDLDTINNRILYDLPVMHTRYSSSYAPGEYSFGVLPGQSKLEAIFSKTGASYHGQELQFQNNLESNPVQPENYIFEAKLKPTTAVGADSTQYMAIQNFDAMYTNGNSLSVLGGAIYINDGGYSLSGLDSIISVGSLSSLSALSSKINIVPIENKEPIYADMSTVHTNINSWNGNGADFILFEIDDDGTYSYVRPTWAGNEVLTGYTRTTLSTADFASQITPNGVDQEIEFVYKENRNNIQMFDRDKYEWYDILPISDASSVWEPESFTILWQKVRIKKEYKNLSKIQIIVDSNETRDRLVWFTLLIVPDGADVPTGITGLPSFYDNNTDTNRKTNYTGVSTSGSLIWQSCRWNDTDFYPQFNGGYYRRWNETILVTPGQNVVTFASSGFTGSSFNSYTLTEGKDYWIGVTAVGIENSTNMTTEANWNFDDIRLNMYWLKIDRPIDAMLPENLIMARNRTVSTTNMKWVSEYKANTSTTDPSVMRLFNNIIGYIPFSYKFESDVHTLGLWRFDELVWTGAAGEVLDSGSHRWDGQAYGSVTTTANGRYERAADFNNSLSQYLVLPKTRDIIPNVDGDQTYEFWFKPDSSQITATQFLFSFYQDNTPIDHHHGGIYYNSVTKQVIISQENGVYIVTCNDLAIQDEWNHIAWQYNGTTNIFTTYLNGKLQPSCTTHLATIPRKPFPNSSSAYDYIYIGRYGISSGGYFGGLIDELRISSCLRYNQDFDINGQSPIVYSTFPQDLNDYAELVVNWNQVNADTISKLTYSYSIPKLKGEMRNFLTGFRNTNIPSGQSNNIIYDDIRFSDNSLINNIDLSDDIGYDREVLDLQNEDAEVIVDQTVWANTDWNRIWTKNYSVETGATITIDASNHLLFTNNILTADSITRAAETHYLTPTGSNTCELTIRFDINAYSLNSEFYVAFLPSQYASTVSEVTNVTLEGTPNDLMVVGFHYNGDVYLYRPDVSTGVVSYDLVYTLGKLEDFDWSTQDIKIRLDNSIKPGSTSVTIWFGTTTLYNSDYHPPFLPETDQGYYVVFGFRGKRDPEYTLRLETGNFQIREVDTSDYSQTVGNVLYGESMQGVPDQWWVSPEIEQINRDGVTPSGSWLVAGTTKTVSDTEIAKYNIAHRQSAPYNVSGHPTTAVAATDSIGPSGLPDYSRFSMYVNIDDVQTVPELGQIVRWIGPYLLMGYGITGVDAGEAHRWDFNYSLTYPETTGGSEIIFGICNWLPTNEPATNSGETFTTHQDYAVYSFNEDDLTENTKASIYALSGTSTINIGTTNGQYDLSNPARYAIFSFVSDGNIKYTKGRLLSSGSTIDAAVNIGDRILPEFGKISIVVRPKNVPGSINPIVTITADNTTLNAGDSTTLRWQSSNADYVDYNNFDILSTDLTDSKIITPSQSTDYTIRVKNNAGASATATIRVNVITVAQNAPSINSFSANPNPVDSGSSITLSWNVSNPSSGAMTVYLNGGQFNNQIVSAISSSTATPSSNTSYTLTATNDKGTVSQTVSVVVQAAGSLSVTLSSSSLSVNSGQSVTLTWSSTPVGNVSLVSSNFGVTNVSGSVVKAPETTTTYTITIKNNTTNEERTSSVTVIVGGYISGAHQYVNPIYLGVERIVNTPINGNTDYVATTTFSIQQVSTNYIPWVSQINDTNHWTITPVSSPSINIPKEIRKYYLLLPGPWTPGSIYNIISSTLTFTGTETNTNSITTTTIPLYEITQAWDISSNTLPSSINRTIFNVSNIRTISTSLDVNCETITVAWNNNQDPNYGIIINSFEASTVQLDLSSYTIFNIPPAAIYAKTAAPTHPTSTWRPYYTLTYQEGVSVLSFGFSSPMVSMQTVTPPQYADVYIYVNNELYVSQTDVPLNFNTTDGLRFFTGARRKSAGTKFNTSATVSKFELTLINERTQPENTRMNDLALWSKTGGVLPANTLFYGRNINIWQDEDYSANMIGDSSILAQGFIPTTPRLQAISLKINSVSSNNIVAYICAAGISNAPSLTPVSNHIVKNDGNIIATSWARIWPGMKEAMFTFNVPVTLIPGTLYYVVFDYLTSAYGSPDSSLMPEVSTYKWGSSWTVIGGVLAFRVFPDLYSNIFNNLHAQRQNGRVAAVNNAGLLSDMTERTTEVTVDLIPPHKPGYYLQPSILYLSGHSGETYVDNYGSWMSLVLGSSDTDIIGSGIQDFRLVYWGNFDELLTTDWYQWNDTNADNYVNVNITYPGLFLDTKKIYAQVRDKVGNISDSNDLYIDFKYSFFEDTEPPYFVKVSIEGNAFIDPDPTKQYITKNNSTNDSLKVLDLWTGCMDFRINHNFETSDTGELIYGSYQPYTNNFVDQIPGNDGIYNITVQCRDYADNATQEHIEHIKTVSFEGQTYITELPTVTIKYQPQLQSYLYIATTKRTNRSNLTCTNMSVIGYSAYTVYEPWQGNTRETFKSTETIVIRVNGVVSTDYVVDASNDWVVFNNPLGQYDVVTMDIIEEVAILYRYEESKYIAVKIFDREQERSIGAMAVYNNTLYIGMDSGRIYAYNGVRTSSSLYRVSDGSGNYLPISSMAVHEFIGEDREYLYVSTYKSAQLYRYGGNVANSTLTWVRLTTVTSAMSGDTDVFALEMYNNILFIATGPYGKVYRYQRTYDSVGAVTESIIAKQLYQNEFDDDITFRMNVLCLKEFDSKIFAGVDYNSSVFSYQYLEQEQPRQNEWKEIYNFNTKFKNSPNPWEFYNNGNVDHNNTDKLIFNEIYDSFGKLSDWSMQISGELNEYCLWIDKDTTTTWQSVSNSTGWMIDFVYETISYSDIDNSYQGLKIFDGTYELEVRIYANNVIKVISGANEVSSNLNTTLAQNHFRIAVKNENIDIYLNDDNTPIISEIDFLLEETTGKLMLFGKTDINSPRCYSSWKYLNYYISGIMVPVLAVERDFIRDQVIEFGKEVRYLQKISEVPINGATLVDRLIAGVEPRDPSTFVIEDNPSTLIPETYVRETGDSPKWSYDASYPTNCAGLVNSIVDNNILVSICEITDNALTYDPFIVNQFMINNPYTTMTRTGNIYYRRRTQAYDWILKDTHAPEGSIIIGEDTSAGAVQVYAFEIYDKNNTQITEGFAARYSALDIEVDNANNAIDGNPDTYDVIGTAEIRYLQQTFSDVTPVSFKRIKWGCKAVKSKTYRIEYLNDVWIPLVEMQTDPNNINIFFDYTLTSEVTAYAVRIYYTGDAQTVQDMNYVTLSAHDDGSGVADYRISSYQDFRDANTRAGADVNGWIPMTDGIITIDYNLLSSASSWSVQKTTSSPVTAGTVFNGILIIGTQDGEVYISSDGSTFIQASTSFGAKITSFSEWRSLLYLSTDDGSIYESDNGLDWNLTVSFAGIVRISSLCVYNDILYIGTGDSGLLYSYDGSISILVKQFASSVVTSLYVSGNKMYIGLYPTGEIYTYDGQNFNQSANLPVDNVYQFTYFDSKIFAVCGDGRIYVYDTAWNLLFDSSIRNIIGTQVFTNTGPEILSATEDGAGQLGSGYWRYKVTYVDNSGTESSAGESYVAENTTNKGRLKVSWQSIDSAVGYRLYRCQNVNGVENSERLMVVNTTNNIISETYFLDDGSYNILSGKTVNSVKELDVPPPAIVSNYIWFAGDYGKVYVYDKQSMSEILLPTTYNGANGIIQFKGEIYVFGQERPYTDAEIILLYNQQVIPAISGDIIKYIGSGSGSGYKTVYCQYKDAIDNISEILSDRIFYNNLIEKHVIEVDDSTGLIVDSYESTSSPTQKIYSPFKSYEQTGVYESEPFFAANLSRWDVIDLVAQLPYDTYVDLYVRTSTTRDGLSSEDWHGPFELTNPNLDYDYYDRYGYYYSQYYQDSYYMDYSYYMEDEGIIESLSGDISYLNGSWLQFKLVLRTENRHYTPKVFSIIVKYISTNAAMFYTTVFDLTQIANNERSQTGNFDISRGILTWNGVVPVGGNIQFGISTKDLTTYDWGSYQIIEPNQVFEVDYPEPQFRIAAVLVSTDVDVAVIDEWAILFECGDKDVKVNFNAYIGLL